MNQTLVEIKKYEENNFTLPAWYKGYLIANNLSLNDIRPEFVYKAIITRMKLLRIIYHKEWFIMSDPTVIHKDCTNLLNDYLQCFNDLRLNPKSETALVHRNLILGIPGE